METATRTPSLANLVDHAKTLDCIHCGLCLSDCPTYRLTGVESSSPRGRIHLMRSIAENNLAADDSLAEELHSCLLCRNCESVCPSGVQFGALMEKTRGLIAVRTPMGFWRRLVRYVGFRVLLPNRLMLRIMGASLRLVQVLGLQSFLSKALGKIGAPLRSMPDVPPFSGRRLLPGRTTARGEARDRVAVLEGCVMPELLGHVNRATVQALSAAGVESRTADHVCCGSLHAHNGDLQGARQQAKATIEAFEVLVDESERPCEVVVNSAGCASHMKEYAALFEGDVKWQKRATEFASRVVDFSEYLARPQHASVLQHRMKSVSDVEGPVVFDDPCHLCHGQGIRSEPRELIDAIPGLERTEMADSESCCGSAGIYSVLRPEAAQEILSPRLDALERSGARTLVTANPGCHLQWQGGLKDRNYNVRVLHIAELVARSLR